MVFFVAGGGSVRTLGVSCVRWAWHTFPVSVSDGVDCLFELFAFFVCSVCASVCVRLCVKVLTCVLDLEFECMFKWQAEARGDRASDAASNFHGFVCTCKHTQTYACDTAAWLAMALVDGVSR